MKKNWQHLVKLELPQTVPHQIVALKVLSQMNQIIRRKAKKPKTVPLTNS
jgi:hypothetical protein